MNIKFEYKIYLEVQRPKSQTILRMKFKDTYCDFKITNSLTLLS